MFTIFSCGSKPAENVQDLQKKYKDKEFKNCEEFMNKQYGEDITLNNFWLGALDTYCFYNEDNHSDYLFTLKSITPNDVKKLTNELLLQGNEIVVSMMPKEVKE